MTRTIELQACERDSVANVLKLLSNVYLEIKLVFDLIMDQQAAESIRRSAHLFGVIQRDRQGRSLARHHDHLETECLRNDQDIGEDDRRVELVEAVDRL